MDTQALAMQIQIKALSEVVQENPDMPLTQIVEIAETLKLPLKDITVGQAVGLTTVEAPKASLANGKPRRSRAKKPLARGASGYDLSRPAERDRLDADILQKMAQKGGWLRAEEFRLTHFPNLNPIQFRRAAKRLLRDKRIKKKGQARATEYQVTTKSAQKPPK